MHTYTINQEKAIRLGIIPIEAFNVTLLMPEDENIEKTGPVLFYFVPGNPHGIIKKITYSQAFKL